MSAIIIPFPGRKQPETTGARIPTSDELDILFEAAIRVPHGRTIVEAIVEPVGFKPLLIWWFGEEISQPLLERLGADLTTRRVDRFADEVRS
jgi:hypothetical protein